MGYETSYLGHKPPESILKSTLWYFRMRRKETAVTIHFGPKWKKLHAITKKNKKSAFKKIERWASNGHFRFSPIRAFLPKMGKNSLILDFEQMGYKFKILIFSIWKINIFQFFEVFWKHVSIEKQFQKIYRIVKKELIIAVN